MTPGAGERLGSRVPVENLSASIPFKNRAAISYGRAKKQFFFARF